MQLTFYGAAKAVTGSCHCLEANGKRILIDCGLQQGSDETDNATLPFSPSEIDLVIVTHAHIDHSGRLPLLCKLGYEGDIVATRLTSQLLSIMLRDSAHIQENDAAWANQKGKRSGRPLVEPIYTLLDAEQCLEQIVYHDYEQEIELFPWLKLRFVDAGHLLGSALVELSVTENGETRKIVFSGDIGNKNQPIIRDPSYIKEADYVVMESTYGDRNHQAHGGYTEALAEILDKTFARGGNVIIPSFAVGRTQELLFFLREIKQRHLVRSMPDFPVYVDSPLAKEATRIFSGDLTGYVDDEAATMFADHEDLFTFHNLRLCETTAESRGLNTDPLPKVIISASGMCDAGRIRHHLKHNLWRSECSIVFVGFQAEGSFGRRLLDGVTPVKLFGEEISVKAQIVNFHGLSSHADRDALLEWIDAYTPKPKHVFVVHGDAEVIPVFLDTLHERGFSAHAPDFTEVYDLTHNTLLTPGITPVKKRNIERESPTYTRLVLAGQKLLDVIRRNKGGTNKDLAKFSSQIAALIEKWNR